MPTVFSHIVQKRLSRESENVATDALAFVLESSEDAKNGFLKLLREVHPELPHLWFRTQQTEGNARPDMWGYDGKDVPHVLVENKFWAGLTENQPVSYIKKLANYTQPSLLLVVVPRKREQAVWRELIQRLEGAGISTTAREASAGIVVNVTTSSGPVLALTSWAKLLSFLEREATNDRAAKSNLEQLQALCEQADEDAIVPFSPEETSDQRTPSLVLRLNSIVLEATERAFDEGHLHNRQLRPQADRTRIGRYGSLFADERVGLWFGLHFDMWKKHGGTPLWGVFHPTKWGRATEVRALLEPWAREQKVLVASEPGGFFVVAFNIRVGEEKDKVVSGIVDRFKEIVSVLSALNPLEKNETLVSEPILLAEREA